MSQEPVVVREATCPSLSATSDITYQIGNAQTGNHLRITRNLG
jgi:hypothetical protein